jgi:hypothetical protein
MMTNRAATADFVRMLRDKFQDYRRHRFDGKDNMFEKRPEGGAVVFSKDHAAVTYSYRRLLPKSNVTAYSA